MTAIDDEAICIRHWDYSETSQTVSLFSQHHGLLRAIAKGSRRERGGFSGGVDLLTQAQAQMVIKPNIDLATLTSWNLLQNFPGVRRNMRANKIAYFAADLIGRLFEAHDPHPNVYGCFVHMLEHIGREESGGMEDEIILLGFQWLVLREAGLQPILGNCPDGVDVVHFNPHDGGKVVETQAASTWRVRVTTISVLDALRTSQPNNQPQLDNDAIVRANRLLAAYIREAISEEPFTMRRLFGALT